MPKLSIITVNLNNAEGLEKTIQSVISQTFTDYEYIIIDGGSIDGSKEIIEKHTDKITYWVSEPDKGIYNGMNKGIKAAKGEYCQFLNSGDYLVDENVIEQVVGFNAVEDIIYGDIYYSNGVDDIRLIKYKKTISLSLFENGSLPHPSSMIRKTVFDKFGYYNEKNRVVSDYEFFLKVFIKQPQQFRYLNLCFSVFDLNGISNDEKYKQLCFIERERVKEKYLPRVVWQELKECNKINDKYKGLLSSGSVKLVLALKKIYEKRISKNKRKIKE